MLAVGLFVASHDLEQRLIDETLHAELQDYINRRARNPASLPPNTTAIRGYVSDASVTESVPDAIAALSLGMSHLQWQGSRYRTLVAEREHTRYFLLYDELQLDRREEVYVAFLAFGVTVMSLFAAVLGLWLTGRVISPVTTLARRVRGLQPEHRTEPLATYYPDDEVGELAASFDNYLERLQSFIERERAFTGDVSHELRTPLAIINGAGEVLLDDPDLGAAARTRVQRIVRAAGEMTELTSALLDLAREEEGVVVQGGLCDVETVLRDVVEKLRVLLQGKAVEVELEIAARPAIAAERAMLAIVLGNIVRNAFAYTDRGRIHVRLGAAELCVEDTGSGIRPEELGRVFQRYYRGSDSSGAGIGLSLVKRICDRQGWTVRLSSRVDTGTLICLQFGASLAEEKAPL